MVSIKDAVKEMKEINEFDKIIKQAKGKDKANAKAFYEAVKDFDEKDFEKVPEIVFVQACNSVSVWKDIYVFLKFLSDEKQNTKKA